MCYLLSCYRNQPACARRNLEMMQQMRCWWYLMKSRQNIRLDAQFSCSVMSDSLWPPWAAARQASPSITNSWSLLKLMSIKSVMPSNHLILSFTSASVLPVKSQDLFPLGLTGLTSLLSKGLSRVFSSTTVWRHQIFISQKRWGKIPISNTQLVSGSFYLRRLIY